jgi:HNH endonuclease
LSRGFPVALLGRCLLAMRKSKGFKKYGCSSEIHYAVSRLGMSKSTAGECRRVARDLIPLPRLTLAAESGSIDWSKLREISRKASVKTEELWLELAKKLDYKPIEKLVTNTPYGRVPGDVFEEPERVTTELRCEISDSVMAMLDRARRVYSLEQERVVPTAEVLEWALASYLSSQPLDEESSEKACQDMDRDLQAQKAQKLPLVAYAREVAADMGFIPVPQLEETVDFDEDPLESDFTRTGQTGPEDPTRERDSEASENSLDSYLAQALGGLADGLFAEIATDNENTNHDIPTNCLELAKVTDPDQIKSLNTGLPAIPNKRIAFNPLNRHATKAQKNEILRRQGWRCSTPGCGHGVFLHLHHLIPFSQGGLTLPESLLGLCTACHANVHDGHLRIFQTKDGRLLFTDSEGNSISKQADLELAAWLDRYQGWEGEEEDSHSLLARCGDWAVFDT